MKPPKLIAVGGKDAPRNQEAENFYKEFEIDILARTLWGEGVAGMEAVACVILNRVKIAEEMGRYWWGNNIIQVCQKHYQFSCWNRSDPNFRKLQEVDENDLYFVTVQRVARRAVAGTLKDTTNSATHYRAQGSEPYWAKTETPTAIIRKHIFYSISEA